MGTKKELWAKVLIKHFEVVRDWVSHKMGLFWRMNSMFILLLAHNRSTSIPIQSRLQTVSFFLKISKEIGKVWRKRLSPVSLSVFSLIPDLLFDCSCVLEDAKIRTVLQSKYNPIVVQFP